MIPVKFTEHNCVFGPPDGFSEEQVKSLYCYDGMVNQGSVDGVEILVTAWIPSQKELEDIIAGRPIFLTTMGRHLFPQMLTTRFEDAIRPA